MWCSLCGQYMANPYQTVCFQCTSNTTARPGSAR